MKIKAIVPWFGAKRKIASQIIELIGEHRVYWEPFCGSGSQIIAAEKLDRRCFAMELEPVFCDVTIERWEQWTGQKAAAL